MSTFSAKVLLSVTVSVSLALTSMAGAADEVAAARQPDETAAVAWLKGSSHTFSSEMPSTEELQPLVAELQGAQVIGIGEATHGSHEDQSFKAALIEALIERGRVKVLFLESNRQIASDLDAYVSGRGGDLPMLLRSSGFFRIWRTEEFADLILWIRAYNVQAVSPVRVVGVDCQDAGVDARFALQFVRARDQRAAARLAPAFRTISTAAQPRFSVWTVAATQLEYANAIRAAADLEHLFAVHRVDWSLDPAFAEAVYAAKTARQALDAFAFEGGRDDPNKDEMEYYGRRDRYMADNLLGRVEGRGAAFWAHDMHVIADLPASDHWPAGLIWVGRELRHALGDRYQTVTFAWSTGAFRAQTQAADANAEVLHRKPLLPHAFRNDGPNDLGGVLLRVGSERFWADLRTLPQEPWATRFSSTPYARGWAGWRVDPQTWNKDVSDGASLRPATDILVWFKIITPSHLLPGDDF